MKTGEFERPQVKMRVYSQNDRGRRREPKRKCEVGGIGKALTEERRVKAGTIKLFAKLCYKKKKKSPSNL